MKLKLTIITSAAYFALSLGAQAVSVSSDTNAKPAGAISVPDIEQGSPISPERMASEIIIEQGSATVMTPEVPTPPPALPPVPQ